MYCVALMLARQVHDVGVEPAQSRIHVPAKIEKIPEAAIVQRYHAFNFGLQELHKTPPAQQQSLANILFEIPEVLWTGPKSLLTPCDGYCN